MVKGPPAYYKGSQGDIIVVNSPDASGEVLQRIARRVREERTRQHLTQEVVAGRARLAVRHFQKVEAGEVNLTVESLARIAGALGVDVVDLVWGDNRSQAPREGLIDHRP